jgi:type I restriction enzyme S subunit
VNGGLPSGWTCKRIRDFAETASGGTPSRGNKRFFGGGIPWVKSGELRDGLVREVQETITQEGLDGSSAKVFPRGTLCVAMYGATVGRVGILDIDAATNQAVCGIFTPPDVDTKYLYWFFRSQRDALIEQGKGGAQPNISQQIIRETEVPLPPRDVQLAILNEVEKQMSRIDAGVEALERVQANLKRYRASVLKAACEGRLVPTEAELARKERRDYEPADVLLKRILVERRKRWEEAELAKLKAKGKSPGDSSWKKKYEEPKPPDTSGLPELPEGWCWATVEQLAELAVGFAFKSREYQETGIPLLRGENIEPGGLRWDDTRFWAPDKLQGLEHLVVREGDVILAMDRPVVTAGLKLARARHSDVPCLLVQRVARLRAAMWEGGYLHAALADNRFIRHVLVGGQTGTQLPHISGSRIASFCVALPPLAEQARIVYELERRITDAEAVERAVVINSLRASSLRQPILRAAFSGKLLRPD